VTRQLAYSDYKACKQGCCRAIIGFTSQGALCTRLYQHFPTMLPKYFTATRMRTGVGCTLLDNFLHVPFLYMPVYFGAVGALQGDSMETTMTVCGHGSNLRGSNEYPILFVNTATLYPFQDLQFCKQCNLFASLTQVMRRDFADAVWTCWLIWIPAQTITFSVVPHHLRVLFVSAGCLVWCVSQRQSAKLASPAPCLVVFLGLKSHAPTRNGADGHTVALQGCIIMLMNGP
jgi:hypothetical protein